MSIVKLVGTLVWMLLFLSLVEILCVDGGPDRVHHLRREGDFPGGPTEGRGWNRP